ncbi:unnamed protein product [Linum trigynum]|uniref:Uncharacterized protein n=1 Tax=Linum trigynum TaxID=586398 RepID=A0AAV2EKH5_9ROSI
MGLKRDDKVCLMVVVVVLVMVMMLLPDCKMAAARVGRGSRVGGCSHVSFCSYGRVNKEVEKKKKEEEDEKVDINGGRARSTDEKGDSSSDKKMLHDDVDGDGGDQYHPDVEGDGSDSSGYDDYEDYYYRRYGDVPSPGIGH